MFIDRRPFKGMQFRTVGNRFSFEDPDPRILANRFGICLQKLPLG
jgi:hypothetical protein